MSLLPGWDGAGMGGGEGSLLGRRVGKAEGEAVEMRAVNSVFIGLQLWFFFFLNSIRQLPFPQASL